MKTKIGLWVSRNIILPRWMPIRILLSIPVIGNLVFFLGSLCPIHICPTKQCEWITRRYCVRCNDWFDMG